MGKKVRSHGVVFLLLCSIVSLRSISEEKAEECRIPVAVMEATALFQEHPELPVLKVGRLPEEERVGGYSYYDLFAAAKWFGHVPPTNHSRLDRLLAGQMDLGAAQVGYDTALFLMGPTLNSYEEWIPVEIRRTGRALTIVVESWTDNMGRDKNIPSASAWILSLGALPAGEYDLTLETRHFHKDFAQKSEYYHVKSSSSGSVKFTVLAAADPNAKPTSLARTELKEDKAAVADNRDYQAISFAAFRADLHEKTVAPNIQVGSYNMSDWRNTHARSLQNLPKLEAPTAKSGLCALILAPQLNTGEWMSLRGVSWTENNATISVEIWTDNAVRKKNVVFHPLLLVDLKPPSAPAGKVQVKWIVYNSGEHNSGYKPTLGRVDLQGGKSEAEYKISDAAQAAPKSGDSDF